jgi:hypothetical protein
MFDLDDTVVSGDIVSYCAAKLLSRNLIDKLYTNRDIQNYDLRDLPPLLRERVLQAFSDPDYVWMKAPIAGAFYFLKSLEANNHKTGILTSRPLLIRDETFRFMSARFPNVQFELGINFACTKNQADMVNIPDKLKVLKTINPDYFFDDNSEYCVQAKENGINTYLISNKYTPWNHVFAEVQKTQLDPIKILRNVAFFPETRVYGSNKLKG